MDEEKQKKAEEKEERIVRILSTDVRGNMSLYAGLAKIKGVSWSLSNAICKKMGLDKKKKVGDLNEKDIEKITNFLKNPDIPNYLLNRRKDIESEGGKHLLGSTLDLTKEFDIKRLKKIKSYRGLRHATGLPVRGQRTRSHFRKNRAKGSGIKKKVKTQ